MHIDRASCCLKNYQKHNLIKKFFKSIHFFLENLETKGLKSNCLRSVYIKLPGISKVSLGGMNISQERFLTLCFLDWCPGEHCSCKTYWERKKGNIWMVCMATLIGKSCIILQSLRGLAIKTSIILKNQMKMHAALFLSLHFEQILTI